MNHPDLALGEDRDLLVRRPDDVRRNRRAFEETDLLVHRNAGRAVVVLRVLQFVGRLGDVNADRHAILHRRLSCGLELLTVKRVVRVRAEDRRDAAVATQPALDEAGTFLQ